MCVGTDGGVLVLMGVCQYWCGLTTLASTSWQWLLSAACHVLPIQTNVVKSSEEHSVKSDELNSVLKDIHVMRDRQDSISNVIGRLNRWVWSTRGFDCQ